MDNSMKVLGASNHVIEERAEYDYYSSDPQAVNDLLNKMPELRNCTKILEPCAGGGAIADKFTELTKKKVDMYDIVSRREDIIACDYIKLNCKNQYDLIITNFPYKNATKDNPIGFNQLLLKALNDIKPGGYVCSFQRLLQLESQKRFNEIYARYKPEIVYVYSHRMKCYKNNNPNDTYNSAVAYSWVVFHKDKNGHFSGMTSLDWISK